MVPDRRTSLMILAALPGLGPVNIRRLDKAMNGHVENLLAMDFQERSRWCGERVLNELENWQRYFNPARVFPALENQDADFVTCEDSDYPERLKHFADRPVGLYRCRKSCRVPHRSLAIVGTRRPTTYGRRIAREFAMELGKSGYCIISGLAEGIDTEAHRAALDSGNQTLAVMGGGLNRCYPASNISLMNTIHDSAGVWSEFPLWRRADRRSFPQRNRIVAGMSEAVLVIESGSAGGSLITARMATEQGKPVYVIPGRIDSTESAGCHALIRDGAQLVTSVDEILQDLDYLPGLLQNATNPGSHAASIPDRPLEPDLDGLKAEAWKIFKERESVHVDQLAVGLDITAAEASRHLLEMELDGWICRRLDGRYERV